MTETTSNLTDGVIAGAISLELLRKARECDAQAKTLGRPNGSTAHMCANVWRAAAVTARAQTVVAESTFIDAFEHATDRAFHVDLARRCLAVVPNSYTEDQLNDIGVRARHWVLKALREHTS